MRRDEKRRQEKRRNGTRLCGPWDVCCFFGMCWWCCRWHSQRIFCFVFLAGASITVSQVEWLQDVESHIISPHIITPSHTTTSQTPHALPNTTDNNITHNIKRRQRQRDRKDREWRQEVNTESEEKTKEKIRQDKEIKSRWKRETTDDLMWGRSGSGSE